MLGWMRKQTKSWFVYLAFGIIIIVFVFFYGYSGDVAPGQGVAAEVNGQKITRGQYEKNYENLLLMSRNVYNKTSFSEEELKQLRQQALDDLIERTLILQEADRLGITINQDETRKRIAETPAFQRGGQFDKTLYLRQLSASRMTPGEFEKAMQISGLIAKLLDGVRDTAKLSDKELFELYRMENEKANLQFIKVDSPRFEDGIEVSPEELKAYYEESKENYRIPERVKVRYLAFDPQQYKEKEEITQEELEQSYRINKERFTQEKQVSARHILIKADKEKGSAGEEAARTKAEDIRKRIDQGEDFAKLAEQFSEDPGTASKGGNLGSFKKGQMVKPFEEAAFSLTPGEVSPVVKSQFGFHIIKVESVEEEKVQSLEEVRSTLEEEMKAEKANQTVRREARRAGSLIYRSGNLVEYADEQNLKVEETDFFAQGEPIGKIGINKEVSDAIFELKAGEVSPVVSAGKNYYVFQLVEREESSLPPLEKVKDAVTRNLKKERANEKAQKEADRILKELSSGVPMEQLAEKEGYAVEETGAFTRSSNFIGKIGALKELLQDAFSLTQEKPYPQEVYSRETSHFIVKLKEKEEAAEGNFLEEKDSLRTRLLSQKKEERVRLWLEDLKAGSETKVFVNL
jgi:peptidyl-prolyl cis-trans isomerase D